MSHYIELELADGRLIEVLTGGDPDGFPLLFHTGSPCAAVRYPPLEAAASAQGLRLVMYSRPGYGGSTARPHPPGGPRMADDVPDAAGLLDALGIDRFVTLGWSGGAPRALACAALLPTRCLAATALTGPAPFDAEGLDWFAGMGPENRTEYGAAAAGPDEYATYLRDEFVPRHQVGVDGLVEALGELLTPVDKAALDREFATFLADSFHRATAQGIVGACDDGLALVRSWGFDLGSITVPVAVWQGRQDAMVPFAHGEWLAAHVAGAEAHLLDDEGHISLARRIDEVVADLRRLAGI